MADKHEDIQPEMNRDTTPHLDVSKEPQTMSMKHGEKGDARHETAEQGKEQGSTGEAEAGNKTSLLWND